MKKRLILIVATIAVACGFALYWCGVCCFASYEPKYQAEGDSLMAERISTLAQELIAAYPEQGLSYESGYLRMADGEWMEFDDERQKDFDEKLDNSDLEDMFSLPYDTTRIPTYLADAGRSRCEAFFRKMYGSSAKEVAKHLVQVEWFGQQLPVTEVNGVAERLREVAAELSCYPELLPYLVEASSFYWRQVRGANRLSAHSYGIAVDINVSHSNYWRWSNPDAIETTHIAYENSIPIEIVQIFERHGFIWGGRWYHYDTMHFEYRPEILRVCRSSHERD